MNVEAQMNSGPISATDSKALCSTVPDGIVMVICMHSVWCACCSENGVDRPIEAGHRGGSWKEERSAGGEGRL